jgi:hypothetical protein
MPKSKGDVSKEIYNNKKEGNKVGEEISERADKETRGKSGRFSGLGETEHKN